MDLITLAVFGFIALLVLTAIIIQIQKFWIVKKVSKKDKLEINNATTFPEIDELRRKMPAKKYAELITAAEKRTIETKSYSLEAMSREELLDIKKRAEQLNIYTGKIIDEIMKKEKGPSPLKKETLKTLEALN
jgi:hypothetical protein